MKGLEFLLDALADTPLLSWRDRIPSLVADAQSASAHGDFLRRQAVLDSLPSLKAARVDLRADCILIGGEEELNDEGRVRLREQLMALHPWRKGPFRLFGVHIDTEWRSDWKWRRLAVNISPLAGRRVLDVGCGNGYYALRMLGEGARLVVGVDPTSLYFHQFQAVTRFLTDVSAHVLPVPFEALEAVPAFDTVFSMGVLYHRRDPLEHLGRLRTCLAPGGELVLETLVIDEAWGEVLVPEDRYAKMRNVWAIPSVTCAHRWLRDAGFTQARCVDVSQTSLNEQRSTEWMRFESLPDFLVGEKTVEGYPRPTRALFVASA